jgi:protein O-GlcNAc transferase
MHSPKGRHRADVLARLANVGIDQGRVEFIDRLPWAKYIQTYQRIDIALDPYPYCGGITTCDALWMGVPVITLRGKHPVSRTGASILNTIGLGNCVAESREQYVELASRLARDVRQLCDLRARLRNRMIESRLMNGPHFARDIEALYLQAWQEWVSCQA